MAAAITPPQEPFPRQRPLAHGDALQDCHAGGSPPDHPGDEPLQGGQPPTAGARI